MQKRHTMLAWALGAGLTLLLFAALFAVSNFRYENSDDALILKSLMGFEGGVPSDFSLYVHTLLMGALAALSRALPGTPWFSLLQLGLLGFSCTVLAKSLLQLSWKRRGVLTGLLVAVLYLALFAAFACCRVNYTTTAALAGAASLLQGMVGYRLKNTLSETGFVARGVCSVSDNGLLTDIHERTHIISTVDGPMMSEDLQTYTRLDPDTIVSMNMWGFPRAMVDRLGEAFPPFLRRALAENSEKAEFFLPFVVDSLLRDGRARVSVNPTPDKWYGVTYREDRPLVVNAIGQMIADQVYPRPLWSGKQ